MLFTRILKKRDDNQTTSAVCSVHYRELKRVPSRTAEYYISSKRTHSLHTFTAMAPITRLRMRRMKQLTSKKLTQLRNTLTEMPPITRRRMHIVECRLAFSHGGAFIRMAKTEQDDPQVVTLALKYNVSFFQYASARMQQDKAFILGMLPGCSTLMVYVPDDLKQDPVFMLKAMTVNFRVLYFAEWLIQNDSSFLYKAIRVHEHAISMLSPHVIYTLAYETKLAAALYLHARLPLALCRMVFQMQ